MFRKLTDLKDVRGKRVIVRLDLNLPLSNGAPRDTFRITRSLKTLEYLQTGGARTVLIAHIDEKEGGSLKPVYEYLKKILPVSFSLLDEAPGAVENLAEGTFVLIENLRTAPGEEANDSEFAKKLAKLGDCFVNEAFSVSHRPHASIVGIPKLLPSYAGFTFIEEVENLSRAFNAPRPFLFILGGAKFETKMPLVERFLSLADFCFVGGALANDFYKAKGYEIGDSRFSDGNFNLDVYMNNPKLSLPVDVVVLNEKGNVVKRPDEVSVGDKILDVGPASVTDIVSLIEKSAFVLWNGPFGDYEKGFREASERVAKALASSKAVSIVGGGDTLALISKLNLNEKFTFISTGGGAMLDFLAQGTLPGIEALSG